jgi:uncharacterized protein YjbI with pentapeptide repeats
LQFGGLQRVEMKQKTVKRKLREDTKQYKITSTNFQIFCFKGGGVKELEKNEALQKITRASTLALFQNPDLQNDLKEDRKGQVISYLSETKLIQSLKTKDKQKPPVISLNFANLQGADLQRVDLQGADLQRADLEGADLQGADLQGADLQRADLEGADLKEANLERVNLERAIMRRTNLEKTNLKGANLERAKLWEVNLEEANLERVNLEGVIMWRTNLEKTNLNGANLLNTYLPEANLSGTNLSGTILWMAILRQANLSGANLESAYLKRTDLEGAKYTNANTNGKVCAYFRLKYPCATKFPPKFNPVTAKMVLIKNDDIK